MCDKGNTIEIGKDKTERKYGLKSDDENVTFSITSVGQPSHLRWDCCCQHGGALLVSSSTLCGGQHWGLLCCMLCHMVVGVATVAVKKRS